MRTGFWPNAWRMLPDSSLEPTLASYFRPQFNIQKRSGNRDVLESGDRNDRLHHARYQ